MAKLSAHGPELGRIEYLTVSIAYMSDGKVLRNDGFGWKRFPRWKDGLNVAECVKAKLERHQQSLSRLPAWADCLKKMHKLTGLKNRWKVKETMDLLGDDFDGVWATLDDHGIKATFDEVRALCESYKAYVVEAQAEKARLAAEKQAQNNAPVVTFTFVGVLPIKP